MVMWFLLFLFEKDMVDWNGWPCFSFHNNKKRELANEIVNKQCVTFASNYLSPFVKIYHIKFHKHISLKNIEVRKITYHVFHNKKKTILKINCS